MRRYRFTMDVQVEDPTALYEAARLRFMEDHETMPAIDLVDLNTEIEETLGTAMDPDIPACVEMMMDPGASPPGLGLLQSSVKPL